MRKHCYAALIAILTACGPPSPGPVVQGLLDSYAPDLRIGGRITAEARRRYQLRVLPYTGYRDATFTTPDGLSGLMIKVDEYIDDGDPKVSPLARIENVSLRVRDSSSSAALIARADAALGTPEVSCYRSSIAGRMISRYWAGTSRRGLRLVMRLGPIMPGDTIAGAEAYPDGSGGVAFGAERPSLPVGVKLESCPS